MSDLNRNECPVCEGGTEFVQMATGEENTVETTAKEVGDGLLELRICLDCGRGLEYINNPSSVTVVE